MAYNLNDLAGLRALILVTPSAVIEATPKADIVERLRSEWIDNPWDAETMREAADEIERLRDEVALGKAK